MAQNNTVMVGNSWVELTNADVTSISFQNIGSNYVLIKGTSSAVAPTDPAGAYRFNPGQGVSNAALADLFPGASAVRLFALAPQPTQVSVHHA